MSYNFLEHATDAIIEVRAKDLKEAFTVTADAVINITLDQNKVEETDQKQVVAKGKDLRYLLFSWLEEITYVLITEGFAIKRVKLEILRNEEYVINATVFGEPLDLKKHNFRVEIKAPTFYDMKIESNDQVYMRFLLDL